MWKMSGFCSISLFDFKKTIEKKTTPFTRNLTSFFLWGESSRCPWSSLGRRGCNFPYSLDTVKVDFWRFTSGSGIEVFRRMLLSPG